MTPSGNLLTDLKQVHVKSEHAMGYLKGRFSSLQGLCQQINNATNHKHALAWVKTCIIIHTFVSFVERGDEDEEFITELVQEGTDALGNCIQQADSGPSDIQQETDGQRKHTELKRMLFESLYI